MKIFLFFSGRQSIKIAGTAQKIRVGRVSGYTAIFFFKALCTSHLQTRLQGFNLSSLPVNYINLQRFYHLSCSLFRVLMVNHKNGPQCTAFTSSKVKTPLLILGPVVTRLVPLLLAAKARTHQTEMDKKRTGPGRNSNPGPLADHGSTLFTLRETVHAKVKGTLDFIEINFFLLF